MDYGQLLHAFVDAQSVHVALGLIVLDFILGLLAAFKMGTFRLSYIADFAKTDVLFKLVPYFVLFAAAMGGGDNGWGPINADVLADSTFALICAAWGGSILSSLVDLGLRPSPPAGEKNSVKQMLAGGENAAPPVG